MPNWCHNKLYVSGDPAALDAFSEKVKTDEQPLSFEAILPTPADLLDEGGVMPGWYNWRCDKWGTKWDASFQNNAMIALGAEGSDPDGSPRGQSMVDSDLLYEFDTAWAPPTAIVLHLGREYPTLSFVLEYGEPGMEFAGQLTVNGDENEHVDLELSDVLGPEEMWY